MLRSILFFIFLLIFISSCVTTPPTKEKFDFPLFPDDSRITQDDSTKQSNYQWLNGIKSNNTANNLDLFSVDASDINNIKIYGHVLDMDFNLIEGVFSQYGYKICDIVDNGRKINQVNIRELYKPEIGNYSISFVLDHSGSIGEYRAIQIQQSFLNVTDLKEDNDEFAVIKFDNYYNQELEFSSDKAYIKQKFTKNGLIGYGKSTALYDGIELGIANLKPKSNKKYIIAITDGYDNSSNINLQKMLQDAIDNDVKVFTVGFGYNVDSYRLKYIAERTGGKYYQIYNTSDFNNVFLDIYKRMNSYYEITYQGITNGKHKVTITLCKDSLYNNKLEDTIVFYNDDLEDCDLNMSLEVRGVNSKKEETYQPELTIWERPLNNYVPLIPYIFFEQASFDLPNRYYRRSTSELTNNRMFEYVKTYSRLDVYHDLLNILIERWHKKSNSKITLIGMNNGKGNEKNNLSLSQSRAEAVKKYLVTTGNIPEGFIEINAKNYDGPRILTVKDAIEEYQRVEIVSEDEELLYPYTYSTITYEADPPTIRTYVDIIEAENVYSWEVNFFKDGELINTNIAYGNHGIEYVEFPIAAKITFDPDLGQRMISGTDNISVQLIAYLDEAKTKKCSTRVKKVNVIQNTIEKIRRECLDGREVEYFDLSLFPMGKTKTLFAEINSNFMFSKIAQNFDEFPYGAYFYVMGHTCRIGGDSENKRISLKRSKTIEKEIDNIIDDKGAVAEVKRTEGFGEDIAPKYIDNNLPEGRMYSRYVSTQMFIPIECTGK